MLQLLTDSDKMRCPKCNQFLMHTGGTIPPFVWAEIFECTYCNFEITIKKREENTMKNKEGNDVLILDMKCPQCHKLDEFVFIGEGSLGSRYECPSCGSVVDIAVTVNEPQRKFRDAYHRNMEKLRAERSGEDADFYENQPEIGALVGYLIKKGVLE